MFRENNFDWNSHNQQIVRQGTQILEQTGQSINRAEQIAIETETIGTEVVSELESQRETLLRTRGRLEDANSQLDSARSVITKMSRNIVYNKLILILIIILEGAILISYAYIKFFKPKK
ncbi:uncharacterized protein LOC126736124 [Anthonomus grandis grandis]|uniref:uncharacterized protein LOC126736124 n=1 Tax=Anthonomus grandis grandis TaxID=2921223 RepID=UPI00216644CE|nr:uncharacterized protein LOC126736124 [Anthonomus grandis grandis]